MYVLDTSALIAHWYEEPGYDKAGLILECETYCSVLTLMEFLSVMRTRKLTESERERTVIFYEELLDGWLDVDRKIVSAADMLRSRSSPRIPGIDAAIAATAFTHNAVLVHADSHFNALPAELLKTIDIRDPSVSIGTHAVVRERREPYRTGRKRR